MEQLAEPEESGESAMSLWVDIEKQVGNFTLKVKFHDQDHILGLLGASGCGKTMTLKCIAGIIKPDRGKIILNDRVLFDSERRINLKPQARRVGYLFQNYALFPNMTIYENLKMAYHGPKEAAQSRIEALLDSFYIRALADHYPHQCSGGQQQRAALARMLISDPEIILLDEPFSALDEYLKWQCEQELMRLFKVFKRDVLLVSHNRSEIYRLCNSIVVMNQGDVESMNTKDELFKDPKTLSACLLTGCKNISRVEAGVAVDWQLPFTMKQPCAYIGVRAHTIRIREAEHSIPCRIEAVIDDVFSMIYLVHPIHVHHENEYTTLRLEFNKGKYSHQVGDVIPILIDEQELIYLKQ